MWTLLLCSTLLASPADEVAWEPTTLTGEALTLAEAFKAQSIPADTELMGRQVVVSSEDGSIAPLICDDASRALFRDDRLRGRRIEVRGRRLEGNPFIRVISFRVEENGKLQGAEYHCDVCAIDVRYPQICPCCQGPMVLRWRAAED